MKTRYFIDQDGRYIGAFEGADSPIIGGTEVHIPPQHAEDRWSGSEWITSAVADRERKKSRRAEAISSINVTVSTGRNFDGDEESQGRMARAILGLQAAGKTTIRWTLANNVSIDVTLEELTEALLLAGQEQSRLWEL